MEVTNVIRNTTMLMVVHQMAIAKDISDRVCFFYNGLIEEQSAPSDLFEYPLR